MAAYADFTFYTDTYLGNLIASADFARLALRASAVIDQITFNRAATIISADEDDETVLAIQNATCALAEEIQTQDSEGNIDGVKSESTGSHSISYGENSKAAMTSEAKLRKVANLYLSNTNLLYAGFLDSEYGSIIAN